MSEKKTTWYIEPMDAQTNHVISTGSFPDAISESKERFSGKEIHLVEVSHATMRFLEKSRINAGLNFRTFIRRAANGPIELSPFVDGELRGYKHPRIQRASQLHDSGRRHHSQSALND